MNHPIPNAALEAALLVLSDARVLRISSTEKLPFWVILKHWRHITRDGDCHVFVGRNGNRYGHRRIEYGGRPFYVHRIAYALRYGPIPDGLVVRHCCDHAPCVNPDHLIVGTPIDNISDMLERGRNKPPPVLRGMENPNAILTDLEVAELRMAARVPGTKQRDLAKAFKVSQSTVWRLTHHKVRSEERAP